jgi:hypothetical protein
MFCKKAGTRDESSYDLPCMPLFELGRWSPSRGVKKPNKSQTVTERKEEEQEAPPGR